MPGAAKDSRRIVFVELRQELVVREARQFGGAGVALESSAVDFFEADGASAEEVTERDRLSLADGGKAIRVVLESSSLRVTDQDQRAHFPGVEARALPSTRSSSILAMDSRWTSSGPSARRSVRELAHAAASTVSWHTPAAPCAWMARSRTRRATLGAMTLIMAISPRAALLPT